MREKGMKEGENCSAQFVGLVSSDPTEPSGVQSSHFSAREKEMISGGWNIPQDSCSLCAGTQWNADLASPWMPQALQ